MLDRDLNTFLKDHAFYSRVGLPYRHGYLFYGKPGTGKTSLINAISAQLNRDVYYMNLRNITSDSMLQSAFSRVPPNQIIVFEDIDAMSRVCHRRDRNPLKALSSDSTKPEAGDAALSSEKTENPSSITGSSLMGPSISHYKDHSHYPACLTVWMDIF
jgi:replication-associated recombination protein RarA